MLGETIYTCRKKKGLTLSELAKRAKISKSYLSSIERNLNLNPSIQVVNRIAGVLDIQLDSFMNPIEKNNVQELDQDLIDLATELKETGVNKEQIEDYKTVFEFIQWKNQKLKVEKD
ncbi:helix-turn-helix domain-containing protein [Bacillus pinisoli]|uniref:helix-turn-helix domain-containing protein n=1 Tax=Bacillus pinisoli TaxID=2901866 RepID=UPI001FF55190|nr:helix-turn-helix transcriptional regulator [Bacillus pinisoli]